MSKILNNIKCLLLKIWNTINKILRNNFCKTDKNQHIKDKGEIIFESLLNISGLKFEKIQNNNQKTADYIVIDEFLVEVKRIEDNPIWKENTEANNLWSFWIPNFSGFDLYNLSIGFIDVLKEKEFLDKVKGILNEENILSINKDRKQILVKEKVSNLNLNDLAKKINLGLENSEKICKDPESSFSINIYSKQKKLIEVINEAVKQLKSTQDSFCNNFKKAIFILNDTTWMDLEEFFPAHVCFKNDNEVIFNRLVKFDEVLKKDIEVILYQQSKPFSGKNNYLIFFISKNNKNPLLSDLINTEIKKDKFPI